MTESNLRRAVSRFLSHLPGVWHYKTAGGPYARKGVPDFLLCVEGVFLAIELKTPRGRVSQIQAREGARIIVARGLYVVARDVDGVRAAVSEARKVAARERLEPTPTSAS